MFKSGKTTTTSPASSMGVSFSKKILSVIPSGESSLVENNVSKAILAANKAEECKRRIAAEETATSIKSYSVNQKPLLGGMP
jgi:hypothetical protein